MNAINLNDIITNAQDVVCRDGSHIKAVPLFYILNQAQSKVYPKKTARWELRRQGFFTKRLICSNCGNPSGKYNIAFNYCPHCGAKMY